MSGIDFALPDPLRDFIFDLHQASRKAQRADEVQPLYEVKFKELSDKYFAQGPWPTCKQIEEECRFDNEFLFFYREMTLRHLFAKQKHLTFADHVEAWTNYRNLFAFLLGTKNPEMTITVQWAHDIVQEFVYHFQDFCQYRAQVGMRTEDEISKLQQNKAVWSLSDVVSILNGLAEAAAHQPSSPSPEPIHMLLGYFAVIERARLECLLGDYSASIQSVTPERLSDRNELFSQVPVCHANSFYHSGVSLLMLKRYGDVIDTMTEIVLHISRGTKPGAAPLNQSVSHQLHKTMDKALALINISMALSPGHRVDDQILEIVEAKGADRLRRLQAGDIATFEETFDFACPRFISPAMPDFGGSVNPCAESYQRQISIFLNETRQQIVLVRLRSSLRLYSAIEVEKLAHLNGSTEEEFTSKLLAYKHRLIQATQNPWLPDQASSVGDFPVSKKTDVHYYIDNGALIIDAAVDKSDKTRAAERYFISGVRKHADITTALSKMSEKYGI